MPSKKSKTCDKCIYYNDSTCRKCPYKQTVKGSWFCNIHLNKLYNLRIKQSSIKGAGKGLFSGSEGFKKDDIISEYSRYDIKKKEKDMYKHCDSHKCTEYIYCDNLGKKKTCWNAKKSLSVIARYANDSRSTKKNNAEFTEERGRVFMIANKNIKADSEIFCDYGGNYDWSFL